MENDKAIQLNEGRGGDDLFINLRVSKELYDDYEIISKCLGQPVDTIIVSALSDESRRLMRKIAIRHMEKSARSSGNKTTK